MSSQINVAKVSKAWEGWEAHRNFDLLSEETELLSEFTDSLTADAAAVQRLLERWSVSKLDSAAVRDKEDLYGELARLSEKNKELRSTLEATNVRVQRSKETYQHYIEDQKLLSQEVKETYEAFLMAKKYYKNHLKFYYAIDSTSNYVQTVFIQFFTKNRNDHQNYSVRFKRNVKTGRNEIIDMTPMLATFKAIRNRLVETNDVQGALCCIRQSFLIIKTKK